MKIILIFITLTFALGACALQPIVLSDKALNSYQVPYQKIIIDDFSTESKIGVYDVVYVNGWAPAHEGFSPPLNKTFVSKIKNSFLTSKESGRLDISIFRVGYFVEKVVADDIVFVGMFMSLRERGFKCDVDMNIKTDNESRRMTLSHEIRRPYFKDNEQQRVFIETCQSDLIKQIATIIINPTEASKP